MPPTEGRAELDELRDREYISRWRIAAGDRLCRRGDRFRTRTGGGDREGRIEPFDHPAPVLSEFFVDLVRDKYGVKQGSGKQRPEEAAEAT